MLAPVKYFVMLLILLLPFSFCLLRGIDHSNPAVPDPDSLIKGADTVAVGPLYTAQRGDTLLSIAAMAKTTLKSVLQVNSDLALMDGAELEEGQQICLLLCSAVPVSS
jgi:spore germination protein YaaH